VEEEHRRRGVVRPEVADLDRPALGEDERLRRWQVGCRGADGRRILPAVDLVSDLDDGRGRVARGLIVQLAQTVSTFRTEMVSDPFGAS
jgi:hypothetical protein